MRPELDASKLFDQSNQSFDLIRGGGAPESVTPEFHNVVKQESHIMKGQGGNTATLKREVCARACLGVVFATVQ